MLSTLPIKKASRDSSLREAGFGGRHCPEYEILRALHRLLAAESPLIRGGTCYEAVCKHCANLRASPATPRSAGSSRVPASLPMAQSQAHRDAARHKIGAAQHTRCAPKRAHRRAVNRGVPRRQASRARFRSGLELASTSNAQQRCRAMQIQAAAASAAIHTTGQWRPLVAYRRADAILFWRAHAGARNAKGR